MRDASVSVSLCLLLVCVSVQAIATARNTHAPSFDSLDSPDIRNILYQQLGGDVSEFNSFMSRVSGIVNKHSNPLEADPMGTGELLQTDESEKADEISGTQRNANADAAREQEELEQAAARNMRMDSLPPMNLEVPDAEPELFVNGQRPAWALPAMPRPSDFEPSDGYDGQDGRHQHHRSHRPPVPEFSRRSSMSDSLSPHHSMLRGDKHSRHHYRYGTRPAPEGEKSAEPAENPEGQEGEAPPPKAEPEHHSQLTVECSDEEKKCESLPKQIQDRLDKNFVSVKEMSGNDVNTHAAWNEVAKPLLPLMMLMGSSVPSSVGMPVVMSVLWPAISKAFANKPANPPPGVVPSAEGAKNMKYSPPPPPPPIPPPLPAEYESEGVPFRGHLVIPARNMRAR